MPSRKCIKAAKLVEQSINNLPKMTAYKPYSAEFEQWCYIRWTLSMIKELLLEEKASNPVEIVESFRAKMDEYSTLNMNSSYSFSVSYDASTNILDLLLG